MKKLYLIDAYALIYRNYYAFLNRPMRNAKGENTSAIFGFTKFLFEIIKREHPHYLGVAFDPKGGSFRNQLYDQYKANRLQTPEDIIISVPYIKRILEALNIPILEVSGYEADDVIGTLSREGAEAGFEVYMVTPDKDFGQLVQENVHIYKQKKSGEGIEIVGLEQIKENYGIDDPKLIIDILAIWGDASDNIPGVPGIGEKGAIKLVGELGTVENILSNVDRLKGKQKENIIATREQLKLSKTLATIDTHVPIEFNSESLEVDDPDCDKLRDVFNELGFNMFIREIESGAMNFCSNGVAGKENGHKVENPGGWARKNGAASTLPPVEIFTPVPDSMTDKQRQSLAGQGSLFEESGVEQADLFAMSNYETALSTPHTYTTITTANELNTLIAELRKAGRFCFDTETTGFDVFNDRIVGMSFAIKEFEAYYLPCDKSNIEEYTALLKPLFEDETIEKIGQNIKFDIMVLHGVGITVRGFKIDTMILHYLLDPDSRHNMNHLARTFLNYAPIEIKSLIGSGARQLTMDMVQVDRVAEYAAEDADVTFRLYKILWDKVIVQGLETLYRTIEEPLINVLAGIELTGVKIDTDILAAYSVKLTEELANQELAIREIAQEPNLNVNSARQLGDVLFIKLKIEDKPKRTKTKQFSTDEEYLQTLTDRHPIVELILEYRGLKKLLSTYIDALPLLINPKTGRIHTSYNQAVASTGRLSSTNPNLQNIPIRDERGREIRKAFVATDSDHELLSVDYSQVELRLMAHLSEDPAMIEAFANQEDIHTATAARIFNVPLNEVTSDQRRKAKTANFGIIYGISAFGLSQRLNIPRSEAKEIIDGYFASYKGVKSYMDRVIEQAREDGFVTTIFGRKRFLADIRSANGVVRGLAERNAINAPIQGSAADIMKIAMIATQRELAIKGLQSKVILQVHDELVVDMLKSEKEVVIPLIINAMEQAAKLKVQLIADYGVGDNWIDAH